MLQRNVQIRRAIAFFAILALMGLAAPLAIAAPSHGHDDSLTSIESFLGTILDGLVESVQAAADYVSGSNPDPPPAANSSTTSSDGDGSGDDGTPEFGTIVDPLG